MQPLSRHPQQLARDSYRSLSDYHLFSQYMLQGQVRDRVFIAALTTFKTELRRIKKVAQLRHASLDWYLSELRELRQQFDRHVGMLRRQGLIQFTLPMELALWAARAQWFMQYQAPQIRQGWRRSGVRQYMSDGQ
ncbi:MAG: hypothetical protein AAFZ80_12765 [Cyanobacteria bacterium P01_A01_bin.105]